MHIYWIPLPTLLTSCPIDKRSLVKEFLPLESLSPMKVLVLGRLCCLDGVIVKSPVEAEVKASKDGKCDEHLLELHYLVTELLQTNIPKSPYSIPLVSLKH